SLYLSGGIRSLGLDAGFQCIVGASDLGSILLLEIHCNILVCAAQVGQRIANVSQLLVHTGIYLVAIGSDDGLLLGLCLGELSAGNQEVCVHHIYVLAGVGIRRILLQGFRCLGRIPMVIVEVI